MVCLSLDPIYLPLIALVVWAGALGQTRSGRCLRVIYVPDEGLESAFVVTVYELRGNPLKAYRRRRRRKRK